MIFDYGARTKNRSKKDTFLKKRCQVSIPFKAYCKSNSNDNDNSNYLR
jgi:hypothetical protein